jgi:carbonic anhydrase
MKNITERSPVLADRIAKGELIIIGGVYDLDTGALDWLQ